MSSRVPLAVRATALVTALALAVSGCGGPAGSRQPAAAPPAPSGGASPAATAAPPSARPGDDGIKRAFPVLGKASYARTHHDYPASDIIAACGLAAVAVLDGVVLEVNRVDSYDRKADNA